MYLTLSWTKWHHIFKARLLYLGTFQNGGDQNNFWTTFNTDFIKIGSSLEAEMLTIINFY